MTAIAVNLLHKPEEPTAYELLDLETSRQCEADEWIEVDAYRNFIRS